MCLDHGIMVDAYLDDKGFFKENCFVQHICEHNQCNCYCDVNANHQNDVAERSICTIFEIARSVMLHSSILWKDVIGLNLWPIVTSYITYIYNHMPNYEDIVTADIFTGTKFLRHKLKDNHMWGCPVYVLNSTLQQGRRFPKWKP